MLLMLSVKCSAYQSIFGQNSTVWILRCDTWIWTQQIDTVQVEKDTVVNGIFYKKINSRLYGGIGLLREDTSIGKVWYKSTQFIADSADTTEVLAFDFSLQKGDTFNTWNVDYGRHSRSDLADSVKVVDSVYVLNGLKYIRFVSFKPLGASSDIVEPITMIEGIGGNIGVLWKELNHFASHYLLCSYKDGVQTAYSNMLYGGNCNPKLSAINSVNTQASDITVYPIPARDVVYISSDDKRPIKKAIIVDGVGRCVKVFAGGIPDVVDVSVLSNGIYTMHLFTNDAVYSRKFSIVR